MNRSEIWSNTKRELLGLKWIANTTTQLTPYPSTNYCVHLLILHFKSQFSKSIKSSNYIFYSI